jgi:claudin
MSNQPLAAFIMTLVGFIATLICVAIPDWKKNDPQDTIRDNLRRHEGLWIKCVYYSTGNWDCDDFNRFLLGLPLDLQIGRGLGITSIAAGIGAVILLMMGIDGFPVAKGDKRAKNRYRMIGGALSIASGLMILVATAWYANRIRIDHDTASQQFILGQANVNRDIFGEALFIGWGAAIICFISGMLAICSSCEDDDYEQGPNRNYVYRTSKMPMATGTEYV